MEINDDDDFRYEDLDVGPITALTFTSPQMPVKDGSYFTQSDFKDVFFPKSTPPCMCQFILYYY